MANSPFTGRFVENRGAPKVISLFSGAGGLDLGFLGAGFRIVASSDIDEPCCETLERNASFFPRGHRVVCGSVVDLRICDLLPEGTADLMIGGPPCQSFSAAGRRAGGVGGVSDFRGSLFWQYGRLITEAQPKAFVFENVRGLLQANKGRDWGIIRDHLSGLGYDLFHQVLDAAAYGVPQHRERLIVVGVRNGTEFRFPRPCCGPDSETNAPFVSAGQALADIDDPEERVPVFPGKYGPLLMEIPPGENYKYFTEEMGHPQPKFAWRSRFSDFLYKAHPQQPVRTVVANQGSCSGPFHWRSRRFSVPEFSRLQSFPPDYQFPSSQVSSVKQIGNSVAPRFAWHIAKAIGDQLFGMKHSEPLLEPNTVLSLDRRKADKAASTRVRANRPVTEPTLFANSESVTQLTGRGSWRTGLRLAGPLLRAAPRSKDPLWFNGQVSGRLSDGVWRLRLDDGSSRKEAQFQFALKLQFHRPVADRFVSIEVEGSMRHAEQFAVAWDCVHQLIRKESSFDSLHPLYGHFTEPYPKFTISFEGECRTQPRFMALYRQLCDFSFSSIVRPIKQLEGFDDKKRDGLAFARYLRGLGWDIRVHQTNRTIPIGSFRYCYPFAMPIGGETFTAWVELGDHRTADLTAIGTTPE